MESVATAITGMWADIQLVDAVQAMVDGASSQVALLVPVGLGLLFTLALPRIIKRIVNTFI